MFCACTLWVVVFLKNKGLHSSCPLPHPDVFWKSLETGDGNENLYICTTPDFELQLKRAVPLTHVGPLGSQLILIFAWSLVMYVCRSDTTDAK